MKLINTRSLGQLLIAAIPLLLAALLTTPLYAQANQESFGQAVASRASHRPDVFWIGNPTAHEQFVLLWIFNDDDGSLATDWEDYGGCRGAFLPAHASTGGQFDDQSWDDHPSLGLSISVPTDPSFNAAFDDAGISRRRPFGHAQRISRNVRYYTVKPEDLEVTDEMLECGCCEVARLCEAEGDGCEDDALGLLRNVGDGITQAECEAFVVSEGGCTIPNAPKAKTPLQKRIAAR